MNPCIRCQFVIENHQNVMNSKCGHPDLQIVNVVTGDKEPLFCTTARIRGNKCGPEGELWAYDDAFPPAQEWEE
jgi:hypothetical protein